MNSVFRIDQLVIHKREGLAKIISSSLIGDKEYFILKAQRGDGESIYVPANGEFNIIRPIMTIEEADKILNYMSKVKKEYTSNTKQRRDTYKRLLNSGETKDIAFLSMQLRIYEKSNKDVENPDMKLGIMDIDMLEKATNILMDELALVFEKPRENIREFVMNKIDQ